MYEKKIVYYRTRIHCTASLNEITNVTKTLTLCNHIKETLYAIWFTFTQYTLAVFCGQYQL